MTRSLGRGELDGEQGRWLDLPLLIISPHYDDAMLSVFSLIGPTRLGVPDVHVLTVFGGRPVPAVRERWDALCGFSDSDVAMAARAEEERRAFAGLSVQLTSLALLEGQYREAHPPMEARTEYLSFVLEWAAAATGGVLVAPAGAGGTRTFQQRVRSRVPSKRFGLAGGSTPNTDHLWVTDVLVDAVAPTTDLVLYNDQPYSWVKDGSSRAETVAAIMGRRSVAITHRIDVTEKVRRSSAYASQIPHLLRSWAHLGSAMPKQEMFWHLPATTPSLSKD